MEKENWIENILNSTNGITQVTPSDALFSKIKQRIQPQNKVSSKTLWLVAASITVLAMVNVALVSLKSNSKNNSTTAYLENTLNKSNQLY